MMHPASATAVFDVVKPAPPMLKYTAPPPPASTTHHIQILLSTCRVFPLRLLCRSYTHIGTPLHEPAVLFVMVQLVSTTAVFDVVGPPPTLTYTAPPSPYGPASTTHHIQISLSTCRVFPLRLLCRRYTHIGTLLAEAPTNQAQQTNANNTFSQSLLAQTCHCIVCHGAVS
jgi:hypothetical protein